MALIAEGRTNAAIARELVIGTGAVEKNVTSIFQKLGLDDSGARMSRLGKSELVYDELLSIDEVIARIDAVTLDEVRGAHHVESWNVDPEAYDQAVTDFLERTTR